MIGKLGLVGGVAVVWLLTFVLMGGDVVSTLSPGDPAPAGNAIAGSSSSTSPAPAAAAAGTPAADQTPAGPGPEAEAAEKLATAEEVAGHTLVNRPPPRRSEPPAAQFRISSFNILGSSHTRKGGKDAGKASGSARAARAASYVLANDLDVIGFQEMQGDQRATFMRATGGGFGLYPGDQLRGLDGENSIAYRLDTWELVKADTVPIPYFGGRIRNMPVLLLKHKQSGIAAYFSNFHNPADTKRYGQQGRHRAAARARQASLFAELRSQGYPVFATGDMNERQSWFCAVAGPGDLRAAAGGDGARNGCSVAGGFRIDWIVGSYDVRFSNYREDTGGTVRWITDHPVMMADVAIDGADFPKALLN